MDNPICSQTHTHTNSIWIQSKKSPRNISKSWIILGKYAHQDIYGGPIQMNWILRPLQWHQCTQKEKKYITHQFIQAMPEQIWTELLNSFEETYDCAWSGLFKWLMLKTLVDWTNASRLFTQCTFWGHQHVNAMQWASSTGEKKKWYRSLVLEQFYDAITLE